MNDIDRIWNLSAEELLAEPQAIDQIIAHYKKLMGQVDSGIKPKKGDAGPELKLEDIMELPKAPPMKRRFG